MEIELNGNGNGDGDGAGNGNRRAKWTVLVYFAADNDLEEMAYQNLQSMKKVGSTNKVNIVAQLDTRLVGRTFRFLLRGAETTLDEDSLNPPLGEVNTGDPKELTNFIVWGMESFPADHYMLILWGHGEGFEDQDHADRVAARTIDKVVHKQESLVALNKKYAGVTSVSLRRHCPGESSPSPAGIRARAFVSIDGTEDQTILSLSEEDIVNLDGPRESSLLEDNSDVLTQGISLLKDNQDVLTIGELSSALRDALDTVKGDGHETSTKKIDVLGLDLCMMGMSETAYHLRDSVDMMIASEDTVPRDGWPYERILSALVKFPKATPEQVSTIIVREYLLFYRDQQKDVTMSACRLEKTKALVAALENLTSDLVGRLSKGKSRGPVLVARALAQEFYMRDYVDLYDFCLHLGRACDNETIRDNCEAVMNAIHAVMEPGDNPSKTEFSSENLVNSFGFSGHRLRDSHGVSIYFPCISLSPRYGSLDFAIDSGWNNFLSQFVEPFGAAREKLKGVIPARSGIGLFAPAEKFDGDDPNDPCPSFNSLVNNVKTECGRPPRIPVMPETLVPRHPFAATSRRKRASVIGMKNEEEKQYQGGKR
jgi:hypothetical protein